MLNLNQIKTEINSSQTSNDIQVIETKYLGRKGEINKLAETIKSIPKSEVKEFGIKINELKKEIASLIDHKKVELSNLSKSHLSIPFSKIPNDKIHTPHLHPTTLTIREIYSYFKYLGYSIYEGPEIETDEYNFDKLNLPTDHPARDLQDTLYIEEPEYLLRTHTSSVETRCMMSEQLPIRIIVPGKCYRNESVNASNNAIFYQLEGLFVDKDINMGHLRATLEGFAKFLYGDDVKTRFRCKYYPQVEPGAGMDIGCTLCDGVGCAVCKYRGWIEILGSGMVHPEVLKKCDIDPNIYSGFAFGMGLDRLVMMKFGITDIRKLYSGELVWRN